jgi:hypothetical protein
LNVGSASAEFRQVAQPWIDRSIFAPLRERGVKIDHSDIQSGEGIDLCGSLTEDAFVSTLATRGYRAVCCCNVLEHVPDPSVVCANLERILPSGGFLVVTAPYKFPYHPDPIDTMFRPTAAEIARLFPRCRLIQGAELDCETGWHYVERSPRVLYAKVRARLARRKQYGGVKGTVSFLPWLFRRFRQTCTLLQKGTSVTSQSQPKGTE